MAAREVKPVLCTRLRLHACRQRENARKSSVFVGNGRFADNCRQRAQRLSAIVGKLSATASFAHKMWPVARFVASCKRIQIPEVYCSIISPWSLQRLQVRD